MASYISDMWSLVTQGELQGIWFWGATYTFLVCGYSMAYQIRIRSWPSTTGTLHDASIAKFGSTKQNPSDQEYQVNALYSYWVSNHHYEGHRVSAWIILTNNNLRVLLKKQLSEVKPGPAGLVDVFYNPNHPGKSFLLRPSITGIWITLVLGITPCVAYLHKYYI